MREALPAFGRKIPGFDRARRGADRRRDPHLVADPHHARRRFPEPERRAACTRPAKARATPAASCRPASTASRSAKPWHAASPLSCNEFHDHTSHRHARRAGPSAPQAANKKRRSPRPPGAPAAADAVRALPGPVRRALPAAQAGRVRGPARRAPRQLPDEELKVALGLHTRSNRYLEAVASGLPRHDLAGAAGRAGRSRARAPRDPGAVPPQEHHAAGAGRARAGDRAAGRRPSSPRAWAATDYRERFGQDEAGRRDARRSARRTRRQSRRGAKPCCARSSASGKTRRGIRRDVRHGAERSGSPGAAGLKSLRQA